MPPQPPVTPPVSPQQTSIPPVPPVSAGAAVPLVTASHPKSWILGVFIVAIVVAMGAGYWYQSGFAGIVINNLTPSVTATSTPCGDFDTFTKLALADIGRTDSTKSFSYFTSTTTYTYDCNFDWKRSQTEPYTEQYSLTCSNLSTFNPTITDTDKNIDSYPEIPDTTLENYGDIAASVLNTSLPQAALALGLNVSELNTGPLKKYTGCYSQSYEPESKCLSPHWQSSHAIWGFSSDSSLYKIKLDAWNNEANLFGGSVDVEISCASRNDDYNRAYDLLLKDLNISSSTSTLRIVQVAKDNSAIYIYNDRQPSYYEIVYGADTFTLKLLSSGSYTPPCQQFEDVKLGLEFTCRDSSGTVREVMY